MSAPSVAVNSVELLHFLVGSFSSRGTFVTVLYELTAGGDELFVCDLSAIEKSCHWWKQQKKILI